jgi:hypothetical protein
VALGLVVLAWVHRLFFLVSNRDRDFPFSIFYEGDAETFFQYARAILARQYYDGGVPFHPPLFAVVLAGVHALVGAGPAVSASEVPHRVVRAVVALIGSLPIGLVFLLVKPYLGRARAIGTALLCLYAFGLYVLAVTPVSEGLYLVLLLLVLLLASRLSHPLSPGGRAKREERNAIVPLALGVALGLLSLTRAEGTLLALALLVVLAATARWRLPAITLLGFVVCLAPWTVRNTLRLREINTQLSGQLAAPLPTFVPVTAYGPLNLALANHEEADGRFSRSRLPATTRGRPGTLQLTDPAHLDLFLHGDRVAWQFVSRHPGAFAALVLEKWRLTFGAIRLGWTQWNVPGGLSGTRHPVDLFVPDSWVAAVLVGPWIVIGAFVGWFQGGASRRWVLVVAVLTACTLVTTGLFFGYARLGALLLPFWYSLVAVAMAWIGARFVPSRMRQTRLWLLLPAALLFLEGWGATRDRNFEASGTNVPGQSYLNPHDDMHIRPLPPAAAAVDR